MTRMSGIMELGEKDGDYGFRYKGMDVHTKFTGLYFGDSPRVAMFCCYGTGSNRDMIVAVPVQEGDLDLEHHRMAAVQVFREIGVGDPRETPSCDRPVGVDELTKILSFG